VLVRETGDGRTAGKIVEVEAYVPGDRASHAFGGLRKRNASMFLGPQRAYVYKIYGVSFCLNVTSEREGEGAAVLIRALEPVEGMDIMRRRRKTANLRDLCRGPGRTCDAMAIDARLDGRSLLRDRALWLAAPGPERLRVRASKRIGITKAAGRRLRFYLAGSPFLSGPRGLSPG
jgi:DNA-3-methyladenine glycosylase